MGLKPSRPYQAGPSVPVSPRFGGGSGLKPILLAPVARGWWSPLASALTDDSFVGADRGFPAQLGAQPGLFRTCTTARSRVATLDGGSTPLRTSQ